MMFEELQYNKSITRSNEFIIFSKKELKYNCQKEYEICITFDCLDKCVFTKNKPYASSKELQAILCKCRELGWIN